MRALNCECLSTELSEPLVAAGIAGDACVGEDVGADAAADGVAVGAVVGKMPPHNGEPNVCETGQGSGNNRA
jgi:hypothetical protein